MEILSLQFLYALLAIIVIDLMLAGDNAIVIALAARRLPPQLQKRAIVWGMVGAVAVRSAMTLIVVWLLQIPGLLLAGGLALIWIAYRLLLPDPEDANNAHDGNAPTGFWSAMRTIVVADAVMGLDNVLAVAGAANGSYVLVVLGLVISVPIVVWGSRLLLHWVERYPVIVYFGAAVLAWTAVKMITGEPLAAPVFAANDVLTPLLYMAVIGGVVWAGFVKNHRRLESRIKARLDALARLERSERELPESPSGDPMQRILVPIVGSSNDDYAIRQVTHEFLKDSALEIHLLNVRTPLSRHVAQFLRREVREDFYREEAEKALRRPRELLEQHRIPYCVHVRKGDKARLIVEEARRLKCDRILMTTARKNSLTRMLEDSTTSKVLERTTVPVEIVSGDRVSKLEQIGVPVGIATALGLLVAAAVD
jgi:YjbE family integral membrane protein